MKKQFNYFYKKYDTIRMILRKVFIYGCYNRNDYKNIVSSRKFDNELKRITMLFNDEHLFQTYKGKSKYSIINLDYFLNSSNLLAESYYAKAFKDTELKLFFLILQTIFGREMSLTDVEVSLFEQIDKIDRATLRNHLNKMVSEGYLENKFFKNKRVYYLANQPFANLSTSELIQLAYCIEFYKDISNIKIPAYYLMSTVKQQLSRHGVEWNRNDFIFKHNFRHYILDEEVLNATLLAIMNESSISFSYGNKSVKNISPLKVIYDQSFGRVYLVGFAPHYGSIGVYRVDKMADICGGNLFAAITVENLDKAWCVSGIGKAPTTFDIDFKFNESQEKHLIARLFRESKHGKVEKIAEDLYRLRITVTDPIEMVPWLRTFYGHITTIGNDELHQYILNDLRAMEVNYEPV